MPGPPPEELVSDRRRSPRFSCGGLAKIAGLPSDGILLEGKIRDLSRGGCRIETVSPLDCGARAEILVRVNASSFRALGQVRAVRVESAMSLEFIQLSGSGQDILAELLRELARQHAISATLRTARRELDPELLNQSRLLLLNEGLPIVGRSADSEKGEASPSAGDRSALTLEGEPTEIFLDLFF